MNTLPGDGTPTDILARMLRVNHAGEYGAQRIYAGQMAVLGNSAIGKELAHMAQQEQAHLHAFETLLRSKRVRPTALLPFWHMAGYALGAATAAMGSKAAMACTVAVETEIAKHYEAQLKTLGESEPELAQQIKQFRDEELEHHAIGIAHGAEKTPGYELLKAVIGAGCRAAIKLAERV